MKQSETFGSEFIETVSNITKTVDKVVIVSHETLASSAIYSRANLVLSELKKSSIDLGELGNSMVNPSSESSRKPSKQKLASCSYEIAKFVKELISLIE